MSDTHRIVKNHNKNCDIWTGTLDGKTKPCSCGTLPVWEDIQTSNTLELPAQIYIHPGVKIETEPCICGQSVKYTLEVSQDITEETKIKAEFFDLLCEKCKHHAHPDDTCGHCALAESQEKVKQLEEQLNVNLKNFRKN